MTTGLTVSNDPPSGDTHAIAPDDAATIDSIGEAARSPAAPESPPPTDWRAVERRQRLSVVALTALIAAVYFGSLIAYRGPAEALRDAESRATFAYLSSVVIDRDLDLKNQFEVLEPNPAPYGEADGGLAANPHSIAPALLLLPGYMIGVVADRSAAWIGVETGPDGYGVGAIWGVALAAIVLSGFAADLSRRVAAQLRGPEYAMPAMLLAWLGTAAVATALRGPIRPQSASWFCMALALWLGWLAYRNESEWYRWLVVGLACGVLVGIRPLDTPLLIVPFLLLLTRARRPGDLRRSGSFVLAGITIGVAPAVLVAAWLAPGGAEASGQSFATALAANLFAPTTGWLVATPIAAAGVVGLALKAQGSRSSVARTVAAGSIAALLLLVVVDAAVAPVGGIAGLRYVAATPLLVLGLTHVLASVDRRPGWRTPALVALFVLVAANLWLLFG